MKREKEHTCKGTSDEHEICVFGETAVHPHKWVLATDYNVQVNIDFCPFCGIKLESPTP